MMKTNENSRKFSRESKSKDSEKKKVTHLHLQEKFLRSIIDLADYKKLVVLYLHSNCISKIDNVQSATNLTHLYLQKNKISKIENLQNLRKLKKLYLGSNCIAVVEGLEQLHDLEELHVEKQKLPEGESLYFDPRTVNGLAKSLKILNVSGNGLRTLVDLVPLHNLRSLIAQSNRLSDVSDILCAVPNWFKLTNLELQNNPVCKKHKYRESIIADTASIELLDGKEVSGTTREFVKCLMRNRAIQQQLESSSKEKELKILPPVTDIDSLTKNFTPYITKCISKSILRDVIPPKDGGSVSLNCASNTNTMFPAWPYGRTSWRRTSVQTIGQDKLPVHFPEKLLNQTQLRRITLTAMQMTVPQL